MSETLDIFADRAALAIAHPGHELCVHGWMQRAKPLVLVLTDGSGGRGISRLASTERILQQTGARAGGLFGRFADRQIYQAVLEGNTQLFLDLAEKVATELIQNRVEVVVGDAAERAILTHDLWRGVIDRAVRSAQRALQRPLASFEFLLEESHSITPPLNSEALTFRLSDQELQEKIATARSYTELAHEIETAISSGGEEALRNERFFPSGNREAFTDSPRPPRYEFHGEQQVAAGVYSQVVRYRQHVFPILLALEQRSAAAVSRRQLLEAA